MDWQSGRYRHRAFEKDRGRKRRREEDEVGETGDGKQIQGGSGRAANNLTSLIRRD